jgi:hypothetical protein
LKLDLIVKPICELHRLSESTFIDRQ